MYFWMAWFWKKYRISLKFRVHLKSFLIVLFFSIPLVKGEGREKDKSRLATNNSLYTYEIFNYFFITTNICRIFLCPNINGELSKYQPLKLRSWLLALQLDRYTCKHNMHKICNAFFFFWSLRYLYRQKHIFWGFNSF